MTPQLDIGQVVLKAILEDANFQRSLDNISKKSLNVFSGIANVGRAAFAGIKASASFEQTTVAFTTLLKSADTAQRVLTDLNKFAAQTPFQFPELANATRNLAAFGVSADQLVPTLQRIGDVASGISQPIGEIAEIYGKARVQGRLFQEDINQLTGRGIPIIGELAKQFGVTEGEIRKLVESGKISFANLEQAFISLTSEGGQFFEMMDAQSKTLLGRWSTFTDNFNQLLKRIGDRIIETFDIKTALENATNLLEEWGPRVEAIVQRTLDVVKTIVTSIGNAISQFFTVVRNVWDALTFAFTQDTKAMLNDTLGAVGGFIRSSGDLALGVLELFGTIDQAVTGTGSKLEAFLYSIAYTVLSVNQLINDIVNAGKIVTDIASNVVGQIDALFSGDLLRANELQNDLTFLYNDAANFLNELFSEDNSQLIEDGAREIAGRFVSKFTEGVSNSAEVRESFESLANESVESLQSALDGLSTPLTETNDLLGTVGTSADTAAGKVVKLAGTISSDLLNAILSVREFDPLSGFNGAGRGKVDVSNRATATYNDQPIPDPGATAFRNYITGLPEPEQLRRLALTTEQVIEAQRILAETNAQLAAIQEEANRKTQDFTTRLDELNAFSAKATQLNQAIAEVESSFASIAGDQALQRVLESSYIVFDDWNSLLELEKQRRLEATLEESAARDAQAAAIYADTLKAMQVYDQRQDAEANMARTLDSLSQAYAGNVQELLEQKRILEADATANANREGFGALPDTSQEGTPELDVIKQELLELGEKVIPGLSNVLNAFAAGPVAGITAIFAELFSRSESFGVLLERVNEFLQPFVDILGQLLEAIAPAIEVFLALVSVSLQPIAFLLRDVIAPVLKAVATVIAVVWNAIADAVRIITFGLVKLPKIDPNGGIDSDAEKDRDEEKRKRAEDEAERREEEAERKRRDFIEERRDRDSRRFDYRLEGNDLDQRDLELKRELGGLDLDDYVKQLESLKLTEARLERDAAVSDLEYQLKLGDIDQAEFDRLKEQLDREFGIISEEIAQELQDAFVDQASFDELIQKAKELRQQLSLAPDSKIQDFLDEVDQKLREILGITVSDFESSLGEALGNSKSYEEFLANWEDGLASTTESALRQAFLKSAYTQALLQTVSDLFSAALADQRIDPAELAAIQAAYDQISQNVGLYYDLLEQLGLSAGEFGETLEETNKSLQEVNETLNIPTGFKIDLERFSADTGRAVASSNVAALNVNNNVNFYGDTYGMDDFRGKVAEANTVLSRNSNLAKYGRR